MRRTWPVARLLAGLVAVACALADMDGRAGAQTEPSPSAGEQRGLVYKSVGGEPTLLDAYLPATTATRRPAVVLVHGGGWAGGDRIEFEDDARALARIGFVAFSVDYRLAPQHPYPAAVADVRAAIRWLRKPEQVAAFGIDPSRIGALGASAGGHLAGMLATLGRGALTRGARIRAAVSWSGPMDLTLETDTYSAVMGTTSVRDFVDCSPSAPGCGAIEAAASPVTHVDKTDAPMLLVNSDAEFIPVDQATVMAGALKAARVEHRLVVYPGERHAGWFRDDVFPATVAFLERYLGTPVAPRAA